MGLLVNGKWADEWYDTGRYRRQVHAHPRAISQLDHR
jgi:hypothetical protein